MNKPFLFCDPGFYLAFSLGIKLIRPDQAFVFTLSEIFLKSGLYVTSSELKFLFLKFCVTATDPHSDDL